jgi:hypothetical protein
MQTQAASASASKKLGGYCSGPGRSLVLGVAESQHRPSYKGQKEQQYRHACAFTKGRRYQVYHHDTNHDVDERD